MAALILRATAVFIIVAHSKRCLKHIREICVPHHVVPVVVEDGRVVCVGPRWCRRVIVVGRVLVVGLSVEYLSGSHSVDWVWDLRLILLVCREHGHGCLCWSLLRGCCEDFVGLVESGNGVGAALGCDAVVADRVKVMERGFDGGSPFAHFFWLACVAEERHERNHACLEAEPHSIPSGQKVWHAILTNVFNRLHSEEAGLANRDLLVGGECTPCTSSQGGGEQVGSV